MPGVARTTVDLVGGTGQITGPGAISVLVDGVPISVVGDLVAPHGNPPHTNPTIVIGSPTVRAEGKPITVQINSTATCFHQVTSGSLTVKADGP